MKVMVGNMVGTSLAMAPGFVLGQLCDIVDLDGPIFLTRDRKPGVQLRRRPHLERRVGLGRSGSRRRHERGVRRPGLASRAA